MQTHQNPVRPPGIECASWSPKVEGRKVCAFYLSPTPDQSGGLCSRANGFLCSEWARANPSLVRLPVYPPPSPPPADAGPAASAQLPLASPTPPAPPEERHAPAPAQGELFATPAPSPPPAAPEPAGAAPIGFAGVGAIPPAGTTSRPHRPAKEIPTADLEALEALGLEICLFAKPLNREVWLVTARTPRASERLEITFREAATLRLLTDAFPGARIVAITEASRATTYGTRTGTLCPDCRLPQFHAPPHGITCPNGHGFGEPSDIFANKETTTP